MRKTYRILADAIAVLVVFQAMMMIWAIMGLFHWINDENGKLDESVVKSWEDDPPTFQGAIGHFLHYLVGMNLIPLLGLALLIVAFFAKVPGGVKWAAIVFVSIIVQVTAGLTGESLPWLGLVHGLNAFVLFSSAILAARAAKPVEVAEPALA